MLSPNVSNRASLISETVDRFITGGYIAPEDSKSDESIALQDVRIIPPVMQFQHAFEGKSYNQKVTIQNCGKDRAFIRICAPSSYAFKIKPLIRGIYLSPGISLERYIAYTYMRATAVPFSHLPIYINGVLIEYKIVVSLSQVLISAIPQEIDFGTIDAGHSAAVRMLSLRNDGSKGTRFAIDLGRNEIELIVEPAKGIIQPRDTMTLRVECLGTTEGLFTREFWIKCETPLRIDVKGEIIDQKIFSIHPNTTREFTLLDFPRTYFGTQCIRTLVVKNYSSFPAVYCTLAELQDHEMDVREAVKSQSDYLNFHITPLEGALVPHEAKVFQFIYKPVKETVTNKLEQKEKVSFSCYKIIRVPCIDMNQVDIPVMPDIPDNDSIARLVMTDDVLTPSSILSFDVASLKEYRTEPVLPEPTLALTNAVRIMLYGQAESAAITIRPDTLTLLGIPENSPTTRELLLVNKSSTLPILFNYIKTCAVNVEPSTGVLFPSDSLEVCVTITPVKIGKVQTKIAFELLYFNRPREPDQFYVVGGAEIPLTYVVPSVTKRLKPKFNPGITPMYIKEVGICTDDVRFNTEIKMPRATLVENVTKKNSDLVAFPNDRPKSLRPWKNPTRCRTIFGGFPRVINTNCDLTYELSPSKLALKQNEYSYYEKYVRKEGKRMRSLNPVPFKWSGYDIDNNLLKRVPKPKCRSLVKSYREGRIKDTFIPLTPLHLNKIKVEPAYIKFGKMAPCSSSTRSVTIHNHNDFPVIIWAKTRKPVISFPDGDHKLVKPSGQTEIIATYNAGSTPGRANVLIDFVINDEHSFVVSIIVEIVPKCVKFNNEDIVFVSNECLPKYFDVYNPVNVPVNFQWQVPESCYTIEPSHATIPPYRQITCVATYHPHHMMPAGAEITLFSENSRHQTVNVVTNFVKPLVSFKTSKVMFEQIPINLPIQGENVLKNTGCEPVTFVVLNPEPLPGVSITPTEGIFPGCADQTFRIDVKIAASISFSCAVEIEVQRCKVFKFQIIGNVVCPIIDFKPAILQLRRIVPDSFERQVFVVLNKGTVKATIDFPRQDCSEYTVLESHWFDPLSPPITKIELDGKQSKELYLHFNPMGAASYRYYLPIIINGLFGPPRLNTSETLKLTTYTEAMQEEYVVGHKAKPIKMPKQMPILEISTLVGGDILRFSRLHLKFKHKPYGKKIAETYIDLKIWNASKNTCKFCLRTDELDHPFSLTYLTGNEIETLPYAIVCVLAPQEDLTLRAEFLPKVPGRYQIKLPIYVRHYLDGNIFNYLNFSGSFPPPVINVTEKHICLEPVPLKCVAEYSFFLLAQYHPQACKITASTDIPEIQINITSETITEETKPIREIRVILKCCITTAKIIEGNVIFCCDCGADCYVYVKGCSDNCSITTHPFMHTYIKKVLISNPVSVSEPSRSIQETTDTTSTLFSTGNVSIRNFNESSFPLFPEADDESEYANYMRRSILVVEEWLFHQGFYAGCYYRIPEDIATPPVPKKEKKKDNKKKATKNKEQADSFAVLKYVELLIRLVGKQVNKYLPIRKIPEDDINRINYMYNVYVSAKEFLSIQGGYLPHVLPEHLLSYNDYVFFMASIYYLRPESHDADAPELLNEPTFYRRSKQSWMDVLLQTYKVFVLARVQIPTDLTEVGSNASKVTVQTGLSEVSSILSNISTECYLKQPDTQTCSYKSELMKVPLTSNQKLPEDIWFWQDLTSADPRNAQLYNESEEILLRWLEYHFNKQREIVWGPRGSLANEEVPEERVIRFFDVDLSDGLVLIALTMMYCPYLISNFGDIYLKPSTYEEAFHNACKLVQNWNLLGLSFSITPKQIVEPLSLQMLMLVHYLYEVLPHFSPDNRIKFKGGLSEICKQKVAIENLSNFAVTYRVIFLKNNFGSFTVAKSLVNLRPRQKGGVDVKFHANRMDLQHVIMVLNGETPKKSYAKTLVFILVGEPNPSFATTTATIQAPLYQLLEVDLVIQSPYKGSHVYQLFYAIEEPSDLATCKIMPWAIEKWRTIPKRLISDQIEMEFNEESVGLFHAIICCVTTNEKTFWVILRNQEVGDFTVKVTTIPEIETKMYTEIPFVLPGQFDSVRCTCKSFIEINKRCPRTVILRIPCRNDYIWEAVRQCMIKIVDEKDLPFWEEYLGTDCGIQIEKWMAEDPRNETSYDIQDVFDRTVDYNVILNNSSISMEPTTTINNVHSLDFHEISIHLNSEIQDFTFTLESQRGIELRHYIVQFVKPLESTISNNTEEEEEEEEEEESEENEENVN